MAKINLEEIEEKWQKAWDKDELYKFRPDSKKPVFSIDTPPPTVSGSMHLGHAFSYSQQDFIARYKRMKGFEVFHPFGFDDNGLATERFVEKSLGIQSKDYSREEFIKFCLKETEKAEKKMKEAWTRIGMSLDWSLLYRTIDDFSRKQAQRSFIEIYEQKRAYRKHDPIMWCPDCETAIAQAEVENKQEEGVFYYIKMDSEIGEAITIATTRPELMPACVAVFVNPKDKRYKKFVGKKIKIPINDREVEVIEDDAADPEFGTGAVYHCTFGDPEDIIWVKKYNLPVIEIMGGDGRLNEKAGKYQGLNSKEARKAIIEDLKTQGRVEKEESLVHGVPVHERCKHELEYIMTEQWFVKYLDLKDDFIVKAEEIGWYPAHFKSRYDNWINGLKWDWCISRQRFFGIPIPVWYCKKCGESIVADESQLPVDPLKDSPKKKCKCGSNEFVGDSDVLDTWFTSSLTPQINCKWKEDEKFYKKIYPMSLRPQAHDIITLWAFNTIVKGLFHSQRIPWTDIMISGWALDPKGKKMSKSRGNVIDPMEMTKKYSADILRYWAASASLGDDVAFQEKEMVSGQKFVTKLFNASRFVASLTKDFNEEKADIKKLKFRPTDEWILSRINSIKKNCTESMDKYEFGKCIGPVRDFVWLEFADYYIEEVKHRVYNEDDESGDAAKYCLLYVLKDCLKLIAPFLPHITEEIAQEFFSKSFKKSIHISEWPEAEKKLVDLKKEELGAQINDVVSAFRKIKTDNNLPLNRELAKASVFCEDEKIIKALKTASEDIAKTMKIEKLEFAKGKAGKNGKKAGEGISVEAQI